MTNTLNHIVLPFAKLQLLENNIVRIKFFDKQAIGVTECRKINNALGALTEGRPARILMIPESATQFNNGAREFSASAEGLQFTIADAMIITSLAHKILVSFYLKFDKPKKPSKAFTSEEEAIAWLITQF